MDTVTFPLRFGTDNCIVSKIKESDFTPRHHTLLESVRYQAGQLIFEDSRWKSVLLGMGEEKAVYGVCDHHQKVFALEVINENTYLNGRLIGGTYFFDKRIRGLTGIQPHSESVFRYVFTGLVKIREFVYGYTWDAFQFDARRKSTFDSLMTSILQGFFQAEVSHYRAHYKDVHDRNIMFEIRTMSERGYPVLYRDCSGQLKRGRVGLRAIDVR